MLSIVLMDKLEELLPGIEEFLCQDLASEKLSEETENKRLYYLERLDILKLPPSVPPRLKVPDFGAPFSPSPSRASSELKSPTLSHDNFLFDSGENDFAAHQREISRSFISPEDLEAIDGKEVKVYDDIDLGHGDGEAKKDQNESKNSDDTDLYEIPVITNASPNHSQSAESGDYAETKTPSKDDYATTTGVQEDLPLSPEVVPPPLPPRREKSEPPLQREQSVTENTFPTRPDPPERQASIKTDRPPDLPARPNLPTRSEIYNMAEKKDERSEGSVDLTDDADLTSYESCNEDDQEIETKLNIKLPKPMKKKKPSRPRISRSSKEWDVTIPYKSLEDVTLSGEVMYKGKLSWTRKLAALTDGRMVCYKPEKVDSKPALVIQLTGYEATYLEKENRRGFDVRLIHPSLETHMFSVDLKDWAQLWVEYMNAMSKGKPPPPGQRHHLVRGSTFNGTENGKVYGSRPDLRKSISNVSTESSNSDTEYSSMKRKSRSLFQLFMTAEEEDRHRVSRMGSIASRASSFFESIGKNKGKKMAASLPTSNSLGNLVETGSENNSQIDLIPLETNMNYTSSFNKNSCHSIEDLVCDRKTLHQGYLNIYSSFNKRKWGKRWCAVRDNIFECYRNKSSTVCELEFPLHPCVLLQAVEETKSVLGLMISENGQEKITVEPLNREDMACWLRVFMNQTSTERLPEGLNKFWVDDESPYHDIQSENMNSPLSDVFPCEMAEETILAGAACDPNDSVMEISIMSQQSTGADVTANDSAMSNPRVPGEINGELYTQVQRTSNGFLETRTSNSLDEEFFSSTIVKTHSMGKSSATLSRITTSTHKGSVMTKTFTHSFSTGFLGGANDSSLFNEILSKLNESRKHSDSEEDVSDTPTDTAYNSATGSENSSLERKNKFDTDSSSHSSTLKDFGSSSDNLNILKDPNSMDYEISLQLMNSNQKDQNMNIQNTLNGLNKVSSPSNVIISNVNNCLTTVGQGHSKANRDQCDSAIFESDSIMDDLSCASPDALKRKIEQLRTHLVELKQKRICLRDRKLCCETNMHKQLEQEYAQLDEECRTVSEEIQALEGKLEP